MGNAQRPSSDVTLEHFQKTFPSLAWYINDESTFQEIFEHVQQTCEFLESRNMDCKDRVYTKRTKEMKLRIKEIIRKRSNILVKKEVDLDMIVDYFSYACIYGEDVANDADKPEKVYLYDWTKLVKDIPEKTLKNHMVIQKELEMQRPQIAIDMQEISEQKAVQQGYENLAQMEYFTNIDKYEDLSFIEKDKQFGFNQNEDSQINKSFNPNHEYEVSVMINEQNPEELIDHDELSFRNKTHSRPRI
ncbi:UNKNOWN [Stylonychia lemnae]|uniref:Uncharacterized protein n=1 Tax=Stylonychia lemnae TaxID=5949 RepID=A0A078B6W1_STYLE|nr:UNKNOWN [Stylonychia lemnae]|eukprot:CDW89926.1 UNKNOWN [Stylonychia lemnae]